ncbi:MAG: tRNA modification GTPase [Planctomycetes bacterium]|nr:tRNA modification GTPase [Planctomycetota bacterium]
MNSSTASRPNDTIAAIATPPGGGLRGVIRVSGPRARELVRAVWHGGTRPELSRRALLEGRFDDGRGTLPLLLLWMPGPRSFTREDVAEFHLPGHPALLQSAVARLLSAGARLAEPGEFTRRAFHAGRIDLTRAEGVLALVFATNESQARAARALLFGGLEARVQAARAALVDARTLVEASLDFDENDTGHVPQGEIEAVLHTAAAALEQAQEFEAQRAPERGLARVVLCGAPNAGKSALFNRLLGRDEALVSAHAGTTRDALEGTLELAGATATLRDTAGFDAGAAGPDRAAQRIAERSRADADLVVWVVDAARAQQAALADERAALDSAQVLLVWHKADLRPGPPPDWTRELGCARILPVSSLTGAGVDALRSALDELLSGGQGGLGRETFLRHTRALAQAQTELETALLSLRAGLALELVAEDLRRATDALDEVSGATAPEDVLDRIFARFCLGK